MRVQIAAALFVLTAGAASAQTLTAPPQGADAISRALGQEWQATQLQMGHLLERMQQAAEALQAAQLRERDLESRLQWTLDNWVPHSSTSTSGVTTTTLPHSPAGKP